MATITVIIEGTTVGRVQITETLAQESSDALLAYISAMHGKDANGQPQSAAAMLAGVWAGVRGKLFEDARRWQADQAAQAAMSAVKPVVSTTQVE